MVDIGLYGLWFGRNYGSILTYYALHSVLRRMGYSVVMVENPMSKPGNDPLRFPPDHPFHFSREQYEILPHASLENMAQLNSHCRMFLVGADQLWNYALSKRYGQSYFLDFADDDHRKVAYATSFGHFPYNGPEEDKPLVMRNLARFDAISVRDSFSLRVIEEELGLFATRVIDPVFLCDKEDYEKLIEQKTPGMGEGEYILAFILNPNEQIGQQLKQIAHESGKKIVVVFDEAGDAAQHAADLAVDDPLVSLCPHLSAYDWLAWFANAQSVLTDSFHGICFSTVFHKDFVALQNKVRGAGRFLDLMDVLKLHERLIDQEDQFFEKYLEFSEKAHHVDWDRFEQNLSPIREFGWNWLENALRGDDG